MAWEPKYRSRTSSVIHHPAPGGDCLGRFAAPAGPWRLALGLKPHGGEHGAGDSGIGMSGCRRRQDIAGPGVCATGFYQSGCRGQTSIPRRGNRRAPGATGLNTPGTAHRVLPPGPWIGWSAKQRSGWVRRPDPRSCYHGVTADIDREGARAIKQAGDKAFRFRRDALQDGKHGASVFPGSQRPGRNNLM